MSIEKETVEFMWGSIVGGITVARKYLTGVLQDSRLNNRTHDELEDLNAECKALSEEVEANAEKLAFELEKSRRLQQQGNALAKEREELLVQLESKVITKTVKRPVHQGAGFFDSKPHRCHRATTAPKAMPSVGRSSLRDNDFLPQLAQTGRRKEVKKHHLGIKAENESLLTDIEETQAEIEQALSEWSIRQQASNKTN